MKKILLIIAITLPALCEGQSIKEYKASNGITYKDGDTVRLGKGSGLNAQFLYIKLAGFSAAMTYNMYKGIDQMNIDRRYENTFGVIKHFKMKNFGGGRKKVVFNVSIGGGNRAEITIDEAISTCEVIPCTTNQITGNPDKLDQIKKLKDLLDSGAITQAEYDEQKKKILNQ